MHQSKKFTTKKDFYKYSKFSFPRYFHNSSHYNYYKHSKYKNKYNYTNSSNELNEEKNEKKHKYFEKLYKYEYTPNTRKNKFDDKENFSLNSNFYETRTRMKTNDINENSEKKEIKSDIDKIKNNAENFNNYVTENSEEILAEEKKEKEENNNMNVQKKTNELNKISNVNNFNFCNNNITFKAEKFLNELLKKDDEITLASNENEIMHIDHKQNIYKSPQTFETFSSNDINKLNNDIKDVYPVHIQRKLRKNNIYRTQQMPNLFNKQHSSSNNFNFLSTVQKPPFTFSDEHNNIFNNFGLYNNNNLNYFKNNSNNFLSFNCSQNSLNNINIPLSPDISISSFNLFEKNILNINSTSNPSQSLNNDNDTNINISNNPFNHMMSQMELNQCILKAQVNNNNLILRNKENTDILEINVKISKEKTLTFKIRRYDDMFRTVKIFCEINKLDIKLIRPLILYIIKALNSIYGIYNIYLKKDEIEFLKELKNKYYKAENKENIKQEKYIDENDNINNY